jgi:hypothetical protein
MNNFKRCSVCGSGFCEAALPTEWLPDKCPKHMTTEETEAWLAKLPVRYNRATLAHAEE